jgi:hypothetical protein
MSSENVCSSRGDAQEKRKRGPNRMKLNLAPKMEIGQKLELVTDDSLCSSQRYGNHDTPKVIYEMDHR